LKKKTTRKGYRTGRSNDKRQMMFPWWPSR
jgi:hypothetical protein